MNRSWQEAQERLVALLAERAAAPPGQRRTDLDTDLAAVAAELDLDLADLADLTSAQVEGLRAPPTLQGRFKVMRRARDIMPFWCGTLLVPMLAGLGAPMVAAGLGALVVVGFLVHRRRRRAVFEIDALGRLDVRHTGPVDWSSVDQVTFRLRHQWLEPRRGTAFAKGVTAAVRIRRDDGSIVRLAQGQLFQVRPTRRPVTLDRLARYLNAQAKAAGLTVRSIPGPDDGWEATRPQAQ